MSDRFCVICSQPARAFVAAECEAMDSGEDVKVEVPLCEDHAPEVGRAV